MDRKQQARGNLRSEEAQAVFDQLCVLYPDAVFFWGLDDSTAELGIGEVMLKNGIKTPVVSITIY